MADADPAVARRRHLADLPISLKVFLAPCLLLAVLIGQVAASLAMLSADQGRLHDISAGALPAYQRAAEAKDTVNTIQTALQHMLSVAANESDAKRVAQPATPVREAGAAAAKAFDRLSRTGAGSDRVAALTKDLAAYQSAVADVVQAALSDPATCCARK